MDELISVSEDELLRELFDVELPFYMQHPHYELSNSSLPKLASSTVYPGSLVEDIENTLSYANHGIHNFGHDTAESEASRISMLERNYLKKDNHENIYKYTLRIKSFTNVIADDGYKWRKYGQKSIKNSPNSRSYYRCTNPRCSAKRQVERSIDDPDTLVITYEGLHFHSDYSFFLLNQQQTIDPPIKKHKGPIPEAQCINGFQQDPEAQYRNGLDESLENFNSSPITGPNEFEQEFMGRQGLLEDMVPLTIRNPLTNSYSSWESRASSPSSSNSLSWSPNCSFIGFV